MQFGSCIVANHTSTFMAQAPGRGDKAALNSHTDESSARLIGVASAGMRPLPMEAGV
jgi:hypothetical protein